MITGTILVVVSWCFLLVLVYSLGVLPSKAVVRPVDRSSVSLRHSMWWGQGILVLSVLLLGLFLPLTAVTPLLVVFGLAIISLLVSMKVYGVGAYSRMRSGAITWIVVGVFSFVVLAVAVRALGPANNYDTGLYHLGIIKYFSDYATIPGLANVYNAFGYNNAQFPLAAFLGNGPWQGIGFRLLNGFVMVLVMAETVIRIGSRKWSLGTFVMLVGTPILFLPLIAITDFWVTSPTSDTSIMLMALVAIAYLSDALTSRRVHWADLSVVLVIVVLLVALRPTMLVFSGVTALISVGLIWHRCKENVESACCLPSVIRMLSIGGTFALLLGAIQVMRDYLLSGWVLYPLSFFHFNVDWLSPDPTALRDATLANARDPSAESHYVTAHSWGWISQWFADRWSLWETYLLLLGFLALFMVWLFARKAGIRVQPRLIVLLLLPALLSVIFWFLFNPPSYRFIWSPLFMLFFIPISVILWGWSQANTTTGTFAGITKLLVAGVGAVILSLTMFTFIARIDYVSINENRLWTIGPLAIPYAVEPPPETPVDYYQTISGLPMSIPKNGDQCWDNYPLCTYPPNALVHLRENSIAGGFRVSEDAN